MTHSMVTFEDNLLPDVYINIKPLSHTDIRLVCLGYRGLTQEPFAALGICESVVARVVSDERCADIRESTAQKL